MSLIQKQIRSAISQDSWRAVEQHAEQLITKTQSESTIRNTEWDSIRETLLREGRVQGIRLLLQTLLEEASKADE